MMRRLEALRWTRDEVYIHFSDHNSNAVFADIFYQTWPSSPVFLLLLPPIRRGLVLLIHRHSSFPNLASGLALIRTESTQALGAVDQEL